MPANARRLNAFGICGGAHSSASGNSACHSSSRQTCSLVGVTRYLTGPDAAILIEHFERYGHRRIHPQLTVGKLHDNHPCRKRNTDGTDGRTIGRKSAENPRENSAGSAKADVRSSLCGMGVGRAVAPNNISRNRVMTKTPRKSCLTGECGTSSLQASSAEN
jgi:hypothetical protein